MTETLTLKFEVSIDHHQDSGTISLIHWDGLHGNDTIIYLDKDGAKRKLYDDNDSDYDVFEPVDLREALIETIKRRSEEYEELERAE
jgi:hypothetical protein